MTNDPHPKKNLDDDDEQREDELLAEEAERRLSDPDESEAPAEEVLRELGL
jgi:hypothetical protein